MKDAALWIIGVLLFWIFLATGLNIQFRITAKRYSKWGKEQ